MKKYAMPLMILVIFETIAVTLWLTKDNLFYLFNFSYIGLSISLGTFLFIRKYKHARRIVQLLVGLYMLVYLGLICNENMQIEGFWYYLFTGVFEAATIHYTVAKIFGPLIFGRGWCGYACWTAMVLDFLPYKVPQQPRKKIGWIRYITFAASLIFVAALFLAHVGNMEKIMFWAVHQSFPPASSLSLKMKKGRKPSKRAGLREISFRRKTRLTKDAWKP